MVLTSPDEGTAASSSNSAWHETLHDRDVVIVSPQYWSDIWVSKHWIAHELSRHNRVLFVEPEIGMTVLVKRPREGLTHWKRAMWPLRRIDKQLHVLTPRLWPDVMRGRTATEQLTRAVSSLGFKKPIVINFTTNWEIAQNLDALARVYYCVDPAPEGPQRAVCSRSDLIYGVSEAYERLFKSFECTAPIHVIPHGFPVDQAQTVLHGSTYGLPAEFQGMPRPICGFVGSISDTYVDVKRLEMLSRSRPDYTFVLIGPYQDSPLGPALSRESLARLRALPNVHLPGPRPFQSLPEYTKYFDVCLVHMDVNAPNTRQRTLFKWLLYLSQGKPVVSPWLEEAAVVADFSYLARSDEEYLTLLDQAVAEPIDAPARQQRLEYARQFSFDKVLSRLVAPLKSYLGGRVA